jgi:hypothetical protein
MFFTSVASLVAVLPLSRGFTYLDAHKSAVQSRHFAAQDGVERHVLAGRVAWDDEYQPIVDRGAGDSVLVFEETPLGQLRKRGHAEGDAAARAEFNAAIDQILGRSESNTTTTAVGKVDGTQVSDTWYVTGYGTQEYSCGGTATHTWSDNKLWSGCVGNWVNGYLQNMGSVYVDANAVDYSEDSWCGHTGSDCDGYLYADILGADGYCVSAKVSDTEYHWMFTWDMSSCAIY